MPVILSVQRWYESEAGWGQRFDGFTIATSAEKHREVLQAMRDREFQIYRGAAPPEYSNFDGESYPVQVTRLDYREIEALNTKGYFWSMDRKKWDREKALR